MPIWRIALFILIVTGIVFGWHWYLWVRLAKDPSWPDPWTRVVGTIIWGGAALMPLGLVAMRVLGRPYNVPLGWIVYTWMGFAAVMLFVLIPGDIVRSVASKFVDADRRLFLSRALAGMVGLVGTGAGIAGMASVLSRVAVQTVRVPIAKLPKEAAGYTIVQLTDVHVGPTIGKDFIEEIVRTANAENPDCVVITGDLVDGSVAELGPLVEPLKNLKARDGVFFVTGNHEYYSGVDEWLAFLKTLDIKVLRNERVGLRDGLDLAGVDDHSAKGFGRGHGTNLEKALGDRDRSRALVLLAHQPKTILDAIDYAIDLQLSGHTHGGQIWPWGYAVRLDQPHVAGLSRHEGAHIYVSRGTGYWGPPMRIAAPAEITRIELMPA
jgi:predicted MPP superfamily phosphohydrolase